MLSEHLLVQFLLVRASLFDWSLNLRAVECLALSAHSFLFVLASNFEYSALEVLLHILSAMSIRNLRQYEWLGLFTFLANHHCSGIVTLVFLVVLAIVLLRIPKLTRRIALRFPL